MKTRTGLTMVWGLVLLAVLEQPVAAFYDPQPGRWLLLACNSCATMHSLNYSVSVINKGDETIRVEPFRLFEGKDSLVDVGNVMAGGHASYGTYFRVPQRNIMLKWRSLKTGTLGKANVVVELPKTFTRKNGAEIYFHINPAEQKAWVTYGVLDAAGQLQEIK